MVKIRDIAGCWTKLQQKEYFELRPECEAAHLKFTEKDWQALLFANEEIGHRYHYGIRPQPVESDGTQLVWSNGRKDWIVYNDKIKKGTKLSLDANEIFIPVSPERARRILPCLRVLPLYFSSFESQARGEVSWEEGGTQWALRMLESKLEGKI